jgi:ketosteroid isomerase-like protein
MRSSIQLVRTAILVLLAALPARLARAQSPASDSAAIHEASRAFSAAYVRGDAAAMAATYTDDAAIFPGESDRITGRSAITRYWTLRPGRRVTRHVVTPAHITVDGAHAYDYGVFEIAGEQDGKPWGPFRGKYVAVWRRDGSSWRMVLDIWNSGPPAKTGP